MAAFPVLGSFLLTSLPALGAPPIEAPVGSAPLPAIPDKGVADPIHEKFIGQIVFGKTVDVTDDVPKPENFTTSFNYGDPIYMTAYAPRSLENEFRLIGVECHGLSYVRILDVTVDGKPVDDRGWGVAAQSSEQYPLAKWQTATVSWPSGISPVNKKPTSNDFSFAREFYNKVNPILTEGSHELRFSVTGACEAANIETVPDSNGVKPFLKLPMPSATGTLTLTLTAADAAVAGSTGVQLPRAGKSDAALAAQMAEIMKAEWPTDEVLKVVITDSDWRVTTMRLTDAVVVVDRQISTVVGVKKNGSCKYFGVTFIEEANDPLGKTWQPVAYHGVDDNKDISCARLK